MTLFVDKVAASSYYILDENGSSSSYLLKIRQEKPCISKNKLSGYLRLCLRLPRPRLELVFFL